MNLLKIWCYIIGRHEPMFHFETKEYYAGYYCVFCELNERRKTECGP